MFCSKCGNEITSGAQFCIRCGTKVVEERISRLGDNLNPPAPPNHPPDIPANISSKAAKKKSITQAIVGISIIIILLFLGLSGNLTSGNKYIAMIKGGCPNINPNTTYEEAFNAFFTNPKWQYFKSNTGQHIVQFDGDCILYKQKAHVLIQFDVNYSNTSFQISYMAIDGVPQDMFSILLTINFIFGE